MQVKTIILAGAISGFPCLLNAQFDFKLAGRDLQIHSFASQGFAYSNDNNYLTMKTSQGSFAMTDAGVNISTHLTDKFRVGAQVYDRNVGSLGHWHPTLDWAVADYRFKDWFGVRAGKVKTVLGLYNDAQDADFLRTWAILPQSNYPLDLRSTYAAHTGADVYGQIPLSKLGSVSYTGYYGRVPYDKYGGFAYALSETGVPAKTFTSTTEGFDLHWNTGVPGLAAGYSWTAVKATIDGLYQAYRVPYHLTASPNHVSVGYVEFTRDKWHLAGEYRRTRETTHFTLLGQTSNSNQGEQSWFASAAYRASSKLELGSYYSSYRTELIGPTPAQHIYDGTITARIDLRSFWAVKVEGHFMDGYGSRYSAHGFYPATNPAGLTERTNLLVIRTSWTF